MREIKKQEKINSLITSIVKKGAEKDFMHILESINRGHGEGNLDLSHFTNHIDLLEGIKT